MRKIRRDYTGEVFGYQTVLGCVGSNGKKTLWRIRCVCGKEQVLQSSDIAKRQSCGCMTKELIGSKNATHGMSRHPAFAVWRSMNDRCRLPTHQAYHNYGARGITVCDRWQESFENFWADMGPTYKRGLSLDRRDNDKGYSPENCRWATYKEQARNTRASHYINTPWGRVTVKEASELSGIGNTTLLYRIEHGWPEEKLFIAADVTNRIITGKRKDEPAVKRYTSGDAP